MTLWHKRLLAVNEGEMCESTEAETLSRLHNCNYHILITNNSCLFVWQPHLRKANLLLIMSLAKNQYVYRSWVVGLFDPACTQWRQWAMDLDLLIFAHLFSTVLQTFAVWSIHFEFSFQFCGEFPTLDPVPGCTEPAMCAFPPQPKDLTGRVHDKGSTSTCQQVSCCRGNRALCCSFGCWGFRCWHFLQVLFFRLSLFGREL